MKANTFPKCYKWKKKCIMEKKKKKEWLGEFTLVGETVYFIS